MDRRNNGDSLAPDGEHLYGDRHAERIYNGMPANELGTEGWRKPWSGGNGGSCVEAMKLHDGRVAIRQSTDPDGPALIYTLHEIQTFIQGAKAGDADFLLASPPTHRRAETRAESPSWTEPRTDKRADKRADMRTDWKTV